MPLPSNIDLATLDTAYLGAPFVQVEAKNFATTSLDVAYLGAPFVAVGPAAVTGLSVYVRVSGVWRQASGMWVRQNGSWQSVVTVSAKVSGTWRA